MSSSSIEVMSGESSAVGVKRKLPDADPGEVRNCVSSSPNFVFSVQLEPYLYEISGHNGLNQCMFICRTLKKCIFFFRVHPKTQVNYQQT